MGRPRDESPRKGRIESRFSTLDEAASYLNVPIAQVYALVRSGKLPAIKLGGRGVWRVDKDKLDAYLERLEEETQARGKAHPLNPKDVNEKE